MPQSSQLPRAHGSGGGNRQNEAAVGETGKTRQSAVRGLTTRRSRSSFGVHCESLQSAPLAHRRLPSGLQATAMPAAAWALASLPRADTTGLPEWKSKCMTCRTLSSPVVASTPTIIPGRKTAVRTRACRPFRGSLRTRCRGVPGCNREAGDARLVACQHVQKAQRASRSGS